MSQNISVSDYISECMKNNICSVISIYNNAQKEINDIEKILHEADIKRIRMNNLKKILSALKPEGQEEKTVKTDFSNLTYQFDVDNSSEAQDLRFQICELIKNNEPLTNREIIQKLNAYSKEQKVIHALKYLGINGIIKRDGTFDNKIIPGENFNSKIISEKRNNI